MSDQTSFPADAADIRLLLTGADPATAELDATAYARMSRIRDDIGGHDLTGRSWLPRRTARDWWPRHGHGWWPRRLAGTRRRRTVIVYVIIPAILAATTASWAVTRSYTATQVANGAIVCFAAARLHPVDAVAVTDNGQAPTALCARQWAAGAVPGHPGSRTAPPLVACVLPSANGVGVFPDTTCAALDLQPLPASYRQAAAQLAALTAYLDRRGFNSPDCIPEPKAVAYARQALARYDFKGWRVTAYKPNPIAECASFGTESAHHTIFLAGMPGPHSPGAFRRTAFDRLNAHCAPGSRPVSTRAALRAMRAALRAEGYPNWTVIIGLPDSRTQPCYNGMGSDAQRRELILMSTAARR